MIELLLILILRRSRVNFVLLHFLQLIQPLLGLLHHQITMIINSILMLLIQLYSHFPGAAPQRLLVPLNFIVINVVDVAGLYADFLEMFSIV